MKRTIKNAMVISLVASMLLFAFGCNNASSPKAAQEDSTQNAQAPVSEKTDTIPKANDSTGKNTSGDNLKIAIAINNLDTFQQTQLANYEKVCDERGYEFIYTNANGDIEKQVADVESLIVQQPDILGIQALDSAALADIANVAYEQGIPVASIYYGLDTDNCVEMGGDLYIRGYTQGENVTKFLDQNPDVNLKAGYIWGSKAMDITKIIYDAFIEAIAGYEDRIEIVDEQDAEWSQEEGMNITENWIQSYPDLNCVIAQADQMIVGAADAVKGSGGDTSKWYMFGQDISQLAVPTMQEGIMVASVYMDIPLAAEAIVDSMEKMLSGELVNGDVVELDVYTKITSENLEEYIPIIP